MQRLTKQEPQPICQTFEARCIVGEIPKEAGVVDENENIVVTCTFGAWLKHWHYKMVAYDDMIKAVNDLTLGKGDTIYVKGTFTEKSTVKIEKILIVQRCLFKTNYNKPLVFFDKWGD